MNPIKGLYLKHLLKVAARLNATGKLTGAYYGALVTKLMFRLVGHELQSGDDFGVVSFGLATQRALGEKIDPQTGEDPRLVRYGHYARAPVYLKNNTGDFTWGAAAEGMYEVAYQMVATWGGRFFWLAS